MNFLPHISQWYEIVSTDNEEIVMKIQDFGSVFETSMLVVEMNFVSHMSQMYGIMLSERMNSDKSTLVFCLNFQS